MRAQTGSLPILIGDGIENPCNAAALRDVASMFGWECGFVSGAQDQILDTCDPLIALENRDGAEDLYGFVPPPGSRLALIVGNERVGISRSLLDRAQRTVRIPMASPKINTVNVAAAAAIALHALSQGGRGRMRTRPDPSRSRPEILFVAPRDPIEMGSAVRSAAAFGWGRIFVEDRHGVWFGTDRVTRSLGRGAARRGRNEIHVLPHSEQGARAFDEVCIVTASGDGEPLERADVARGPRQLIVIPDQGAEDELDLHHLAHRVRRVRLSFLDEKPLDHRFRLFASIALSEVARQVGVRQRTRRVREAFSEDFEERT